ncbi:TPA: hypothetical protein ACLHMH_000490 [Acinetobacter baumannii]
MVIKISLLIIYLLIICLFILILNPKWQSYLKEILFYKKNIRKPSVETINNDLPLNIPQDKTKEFKSKLKIINEKLLDLKKYLITHKNETIIDFTSAIDNITTNLSNLSTDDIYILDIIEKNLNRIETPISPLLPARDIINKIWGEILGIKNLLHYYGDANKDYSSGMKEFYKNSLAELSIELSKFRKLKGILENSATTKVYENAKKKYSIAFYIYIGLLISTITGLLFFSFYIIKEKAALKEIGMDIYDYWTIKITCIFIFATMITFLLKQIAHYQKKRDEAERTTLELKALPSYLADLEAKDATNLRKDLAPKYFGKSNDNSTLNEIGNIVTEQLKTSSDVVKSSAEIIKSLKPKP